MGVLLDVQGLSKRFSGVRAVQDVSFTVPEGAIFAVIGPNGAGKTTLFNMVVGALLRATDVGKAKIAAREVIERLDLDGKRHQKASSLTLPDRKRLEVA